MSGSGGPGDIFGELQMQDLIKAVSLPARECEKAGKAEESSVVVIEG